MYVVRFRSRYAVCSSSNACTTSLLAWLGQLVHRLLTEVAPSRRPLVVLPSRTVPTSRSSADVTPTPRSPKEDRHDEFITFLIDAGERMRRALDAVLPLSIAATTPPTTPAEIGKSA